MWFASWIFACTLELHPTSHTPDVPSIEVKSLNPVGPVFNNERIRAFEYDDHTCVLWNRHEGTAMQCWPTSSAEEPEDSSL